MQAYRYRITPKSPLGTPLRSDTLMGQCLWAAALMDGERAVTELIREFESEDPPFILSSGFPADMLPMPVLPPLPRASGKGREYYRQGKNIKDFAKLKWIGLDIWRQCRDQLGPSRLFQHWDSIPHAFSDAGAIPFLEPHNTIDRRSDTVLEGGFFFTESQLPCASTELDVYAQTSDPERLDRYLDFVCRHGYGKDTSIGRGHLGYRRLDDDVSDLFRAEGTHSMLLSVFSASDLSGTQGYYKPFVKRGRVWEPGGRTPLKKPILAFEEGSVLSGFPRGSYVLRNIHSDERVVQIMWPLGLPCTIEEEV
jgi:CRISPR-associated protein Csm4